MTDMGLNDTLALLALPEVMQWLTAHRPTVRFYADSDESESESRFAQTSPNLRISPPLSSRLPTPPSSQ